MIAAVVVRDASEAMHARTLITLRALLPHVGVLARGTYACAPLAERRVPSLRETGRRPMIALLAQRLIPLLERASIRLAR